MLMLNEFSGKTGSYYWISVDLHVHSIYSGATLTPLEILQCAGAVFLDAVAISDHNEARGALEGQIIAAKSTELPLMIASQEISIGEHCHFLLLGSSQAQPDVDRYKIRELLQCHRERGGVVILAHPWTAFRNSWFKRLFHDLVVSGLIDGVELYNSSALEIPRAAMSALKELWENWVGPYHLAVIGGSDYHYWEKGRKIGGGRTYLKVKGESEAAVLDALRNRRCVAGLRGGAEYDFPGEIVGNHRYLGAEMWWNELHDLISYLEWRTVEMGKLDCRLSRFLKQLLDAGCFGQVAELLK